MTLVTDENGMITGEEKLDPMRLETAQSSAIRPETAPGITMGTVGNEGSGLCFANHVHKHTNEWYNDSVITQIDQTVAEITDMCTQEMEKDAFNILAWLTDTSVALVEFGLQLTVLGGAIVAKISPPIINFLIRTLNRMLDWNIKEVEVDGEKIDVEKLIEDLEKIFN